MRRGPRCRLIHAHDTRSSLPTGRPPSRRRIAPTRTSRFRSGSYSDQLFEDQYHGQQLETQTADEEFANLWKTIQGHQQDGNLLSFFLSDNGYAWGNHGLWGKGEPYIENSRVPFYVRWPGHFTAGAVDPRIAANIDIAPTIYQATGINPGYHELAVRWGATGGTGDNCSSGEAHNPVIPPWSSYLAPGKRRYRPLGPTASSRTTTCEAIRRR